MNTEYLLCSLIFIFIYSARKEQARMKKLWQYSDLWYSSAHSR